MILKILNIQVRLILANLAIFIKKDYYIIHGEGKKAVRKIFSKVEFTNFEKEGIQQLKQAVASEKLSIPS